MNTLKKFMALIVFVTLSVFPAHAKEKPSLAPVSKEFIEWQKRIREQKDPRYKVNNTSLTVHATGYRPSTVDTSHLSKNLPRRKSQNQSDKFLAKASTIPAPLPVSYDLRTLGRVTPVKAQNPYGTCWTFSSLGACESNYLTQKLESQNQISYLGDIPDLSELHMAWFVYNDPKPGYNFSTPNADNDLDGGGNWYMSTAYMTRLSGPMNESALPYSLAASMDVLSQDPEAYKPVMLELKEALLIGVLAPDMEAKVRENIIKLIKENIIENGGVQISYYAARGAYSSEEGDDIYFDNSQGTLTNHAVIVVGWDDNFPRESFDKGSQPYSNGAWLVRNSWEADWPTKKPGGYFWISYEQYIDEIASNIVNEYESGTKHYGYDALGWFQSISSKWGANVFKISGVNEGIKKVGFYTTNNNTSYDLYIYDLGTEKPSAPITDTAKLLYSSKGNEIPYAGYHTEQLDKVISIDKGRYISVIMKMYSDFEYPTAIEYLFNDYSDNMIVNPGESYFSKSDSTDIPLFSDWKDGFEVFGEGDSANACIKIFTVPVDKSGVAIDATNFPDEKFRAFAKTKDSNENNYLTYEEIAGVKVISLADSAFDGITSLKGIEVFTELVSLDLAKRKLTSIDISNNTKLEELICPESGLEFLDLSENVLLTKLNCANNPIKSLNLDGKTLLGTSTISGDISEDTKVTDTLMHGAYKYMLDLLPLLSDDYKHVSADKALDSSDANVELYFENVEGVVYFKTKPAKMTYFYDTGATYKETGAKVYLEVSVAISDETISAKPLIKTSNLPDGYLKVSYDAVLSADVTQDKPITWKITAKSLPDGLELDSNTGKISGVPEKLGAFDFTATAISEGGSSDVELSIKINNVSPDITASTNSVTVTAGEAIPSVTINVLKGANIQWLTSGALPSGLTTTSTDISFIISGTTISTDAGKNFTYTVTASNDMGKDSEVISFDVKAKPTVIEEDITDKDSDAAKPTGNNHGQTTVTTPEEAETVEELISKMTSEEKQAITSLKISPNVKSLSGIEELTNLQSLDLAENEAIEELDLSGNTTIKTLNINNTNIKAINVKGCTSLETLSFDNSDVSKLNLDGCTSLKELTCDKNSLLKLDLYALAGTLEEVSCSGQEVKFGTLSKDFDFNTFIASSAYVSAASDSPSDNVTNIKAYDSEGKEISANYDKNTGKVAFDKVPAKITYDYITGFKDTSMDVTISSAASTALDGEDKNAVMLGSSGGGCGTGLGFMGLLVVSLLTKKPLHSSDFSRE